MIRDAGAGDPQPTWRLTLASSTSEQHSYTVAGIAIESELELALAWTLPVDVALGRAGDVGAGSDRRLVWDDRGWLGGSWRPVRSFYGPEGYDLEVEGFGWVYVRPAPRRVHWVPAGAGSRLGTSPDPSLVQEVLLGPVLVLMLAYEGTFCLHAGCVQIGEVAVGFLGESGCGKSTLSHPAGHGWARIGDDVLPVGLPVELPVELPVDRPDPRALGRFPQLKLAPHEQYPLEAAERRRLSALFDLVPEIERAATCRIGGTPYSIRQATLALVRHTVASKLFARDLLGRQLEWCETLARAIPIYRWVYPHDASRLAEVRRAIGDHL